MVLGYDKLTKTEIFFSVYFWQEAYLINVAFGRAMRELLAISFINYKPPCYRSTRTHQHHKRIHTQNIFTLKGKSTEPHEINSEDDRQIIFPSHNCILYVYIFTIMFMILHIFYFIFIYLNENLFGFLTMVSPNGPYASNNFFSAKNYQRLVQIGLARRRLVQDGAAWCSLVQISAGWCSLMKIGAAWCTFVQFDADYRMLGQSSSI